MYGDIATRSQPGFGVSFVVVWVGYDLCLREGGEGTLTQGS